MHEVAGEQERRAGWAGSGSGYRYRDRDRQRVWTWCRRFASSKRCGAVSRLERRLLKRKEQFSSAWAVVCKSFRPSFLKTYTLWRPAPWRCQSRFTDQSDALGKRRGRLGICRARQILVSGRTSKSLWGWSYLCVGSRGAVVSAALSERKVAGSIPTIGDFHTVGPCKKAVFACLATVWPSCLLQSNLRPPKGLGVSGPIFQVVSFARFGSKNFNMELYTCPCASHVISYSDRWFSRVSGGVAKRSLQTLLQTRWSLVRSACEGKVRQSKVFFAQFYVCGRFLQVGSTLWADLRCPQFAFLRWSQFQERTPYIWIREFKGLKLCVRNFQVVARTGSTVSSLTQPPERHNDETWKGLGNVTVFCVQCHCVLARTTGTLSCGRTTV